MGKDSEAKKWADDKESKKASSDLQHAYYYYIRVPIDVDVADHHSDQLPPPPPPPPPYVVVPLRSGGGGGGKPGRLRKCISCKCYCLPLVIVLSILLLVAVGLIVWLSQPKVNVVRVHLNHMNITSAGGGEEDAGASSVLLDASLDLEIRVQNKDLNMIPYSCNLASVFLGYQGVWHQPTVTNQKTVNGGGVSYLEATVGFNGTQLRAAPETAMLLGGDYSVGGGAPPQQRHGGGGGGGGGGGVVLQGEGLVPLDIVVEVGASYHFLYLYLPVQGRISCSVSVDMENQTIANQNCYPVHGIVMDLQMV